MTAYCKTESELLDEAMTRYMADRQKAWNTNCEGFLALCESPIERVLGAFMLQAWLPQKYPPSIFVEKQFTYDDRLAPEDLGDILIVFPQMKIDAYRMDFFLFYRQGDTEHRIVIECDGHDFHERTKEQAQKDRSRDRWMTAQGLPVLRFTGSEIWASPVSCVREINCFLGQ